MENCLIIVNTYKEESQKLAAEIQLFLKQRNIYSAVYEFNGFSDVYPFAGYDFVITLGGDGTVLFACRGCANLEIPVFPVNLGQFEVFRRGKSVISGCGLNDIVVNSKFTARIINLELACNDIPLGECKADGVIVATSTGSTAYSASAGGPIVDPEVEAFVLTPINPFSLSMRPLVMNSNSELSIKIMPSRDCYINMTVDGQKPYELFESDIVKITKLQKNALLAGTSKDNFYDALRFKLNWSGGPHA